MESSSLVERSFMAFLNFSSALFFEAGSILVGVGAGWELEELVPSLFFLFFFFFCRVGGMNGEM
jgi:hypothetical protein